MLFGNLTENLEVAQESSERSRAVELDAGGNVKKALQLDARPSQSTPQFRYDTLVVLKLVEVFINSIRSMTKHPKCGPEPVFGDTVLRESSSLDSQAHDLSYCRRMAHHLLCV